MSQDYQAQFIKKHALQADVFIGADKFSNLFYTKNRTLYKASSNEILEYAALDLGEITTVDIVNPLKISVFYKQSNTAVLLDNTLTEITRVNFSNLEDFRNTILAKTANDRRLWIFNTDLQQLELFDYRLNKVIVQFPPLDTIPEIFASNFNLCWLQNQGVLRTYNIYGTLVNESSTSLTFDSLVQSQNTLIGLKDNTFYIKSVDSDSFVVLDNLEITPQEFSLIGEILYIYNGQSLMTYTIKPSK
jgi:hypothetical protein